MKERKKGTEVIREIERETKEKKKKIATDKREKGDDKMTGKKMKLGFLTLKVGLAWWGGVL